MQQQKIDQIEVLLQFDPSNTLQGIKIHHSTAREGLVEAAQQLFDNGLISQPDGGYLTDLGHETADHLHTAIQLMSPPS